MKTMDSNRGECCYERRAGRRANYYLPISIRSMLDEENNKGEEAYTVNVGNRGAYFLSKAQWKPWERCEVTIWKRSNGSTPHEGPFFHSRGWVVRIEELEKEMLGSDGRHGVAVMFDEPLDLQKAAKGYWQGDKE